MRELETERLRLRRLCKDDAQAMFNNWASNPNVTKYLEWQPHENIDVTKAYLDYILPEYDKPDCYRWGIERKSDGILMGAIDVVRFKKGCPVIGYSSGESFWGNGYMTEACKAVIEELFADGYKTIFISAVKDNVGSNRVIEKCGFKFVKSIDEQMSYCKPEIVTKNYYRLDR